MGRAGALRPGAVRLQFPRDLDAAAIAVVALHIETLVAAEPGCGPLIENEAAVASDPVLEDIRLACGVTATEAT